MIGYYLSVGFGVYAAMVATNFKKFKGANAEDVARGVVFGLFLWPWALVIIYKDSR